jgi:hypothetical protein
MPRIIMLSAILPLICACASAFESGKVRNEVAAVTQEDTQRAKVVDAIQKGATPAQAMDKVAAGPEREKAGPQ